MNLRDRFAHLFEKRQATVTTAPDEGIIPNRAQRRAAGFRLRIGKLAAPIMVRYIRRHYLDLGGERPTRRQRKHRARISRLGDRRFK